MANILLVINIVASYMVWASFTRALYTKVKNTLIYVTFVSTIYSIIPLYHILVYGRVLALLPVVLTYTLILLSRGKSPTQVTLIPLPIIATSMYLLLV
jgi:hypothetical protein